MLCAIFLLVVCPVICPFRFIACCVQPYDGQVFIMIYVISGGPCNYSAACAANTDTSTVRFYLSPLSCP